MWAKQAKQARNGSSRLWQPMESVYLMQIDSDVNGCVFKYLIKEFFNKRLNYIIKKLQSSLLSFLSTQ